jgi:glycosyltransferase involved in cell wall biosynthesis
MISEPSVSILIPTYNRSNMIKECIYSALHQNYHNTEIIIVDNCSTDGTWEIIKELSNTNPKIRAIRNTHNIGPVQNWKKCIMKASGQYAKLLFSDDMLRPECIQDMLPLFNKDVAFVFSAVKMGISLENSNCHFLWQGASTRPLLINRDEYIRYALLQFGSLVSPGAALFRTLDLRNNFIDTLPGYDNPAFFYYGAGPDMLLFLLTALHYKFVAHVPKALVYFRDHKESATSKALATGHWPIRDSYNRTRIWFAEQYQEPRLVTAVATRLWLTELVTKRDLLSIINPVRMISSYTKVCDVTLLDIVKIFPTFIRNAFRYYRGNT